MAILSLSACDYERRDWYKAQQTNAIEAYKSYLIKYPQGKYVSEALTAIQNKAKELEQQEHYQEARIVYTYITEKYPNSKEATESEERLLVVYQAIEWEKAQLSNTVGAYQTFISNYPNSINVSLAKSAIAKLKEAAAVEAKKKSKASSVARTLSATREMDIYNYLQARWDYYEKRDGKYIYPKHDRLALSDACKKFGVTEETALKTFVKCDRRKLGRRPLSESALESRWQSYLTFDVK